MGFFGGNGFHSFQSLKKLKEYVILNLPNHIPRWRSTSAAERQNREAEHFRGLPHWTVNGAETVESECLVIASVSCCECQAES